MSHRSPPRTHIRSRRAAGFSLVEMLVVVTIVGVVTALAMPGMSAAAYNRRISRAAHDVLRLARRARSANGSRMDGRNRLTASTTWVPSRIGKNEPMQPVIWTRTPTNEAGKTNKILCTTMGAASDLPSEGLRRVIVNGAYWATGLEVPANADVAVVGEFKPSMYGFGGFIKGVKPEAHELK